jgi:hypothetical protein
VHSFNDEQGRRWEVVVNVSTRDRVKDRVGVDVFKLYADEAERVFSDPSLLVNVLYVLVEPQATAAGVTDQQFGESMVGDAIERGADALMEDVASFFPKAKAELLRKIKRKGTEAAATVMQAATAFVESFRTSADSAIS